MHRTVGEFYDEPGMEWSLRNVGPHLHPGSEAATADLAVRAAAAGFVTGRLIIDVASALGAPARFIARRFGSRVLSIDMDPRMHAAAVVRNREEGLTRVIQPVLARTERLPLADSSCDAAWSQDALCHMDKLAVLAEVARVLKPTAIWAFTDFIAHHSITAEDLEALDRLWAFPSLLTIAGYVAALDSLGFEVLLAEDRTTSLLSARGDGLPDDAAWWAEFGARWGHAELEARIEAGRAWQDLLRTGRTGYGMFIARRLSGIA